MKWIVLFAGGIAIALVLILSSGGEVALAQTPPIIRGEPGISACGVDTCETPTCLLQGVAAAACACQP